jgi:hypothetical protein
MFRTRVRVGICLLLISCVFPVVAQQPAATGNAIVPPMVKFSGTVTDANGKSLSGMVGVTFSLYKDSPGGAPLWMETQNVQPDKSGHYTVMLGSSSSQGLPPDLFVSGEARWLGVQAQGQAEQPRTVLLSVPYALKAADAETLGGKPLSAFQLAAPQTNNSGVQKAAPPAEQANEIHCAGGAACKTSFIPVFATNGGSAKVSDSIITQSGTTVSVTGDLTSSGNITAGNLNAANATLSNDLSVSSSSETAIVGTTTASDFRGVYGIEYATAGGGIGVEGVTESSASNAYGVYGLAASNSGSPIGVYGQVYGTAGAGVFGLNGAQKSSTGVGYGTAGIWGDAGSQSGVFFSVVGTADDGLSGVFVNNSPTGYTPLYAEGRGTLSYPLIVENTANHTYCTVDFAGNLNCSGTKNAVVPLDNGKRKVALSAIESPKNWFEDAGSAQLVNGAAVIMLDPDFTQTVNTEMEYNVFLTPYGNCKGLYVTNRTAKSFEVHELGGGTTSLSFGYRIMALRRKYENVRFADHTNDPDPSKMMAQMRKTKSTSSTDPASVKPASQPVARVPVAQLTNK